MEQKDAVYTATKRVIEEHGIHFEDGMRVSDHLNTAMREAISVILRGGFMSGDIEFKNTDSNRAKLQDPDALKRYVSGLMSNWYRRDPRMNGDEKYEPKNPGSRAGSSDPEIKELRKLLRSGRLVNDTQVALTKERLDKRLKELAATKPNRVEVDISVLSPELIAALGIKQ